MLLPGRRADRCTVFPARTLCQSMDSSAAVTSTPAPSVPAGPACQSSGYHQGPTSLMTQKTDGRAEGAAPLESTQQLLANARAGDSSALDRLFQRCLPPLRRWARGRLPLGARGTLDTQDLVQDTVLRTLTKLDDFEPRHEGALQKYLRQAILNRVRDEARRLARRPNAEELDDAHPSDGASPLEIAIGREGVERYEAALSRLRPSDQEAIVGRLELQHDYEELAVMLGKSNANAARVAVTRAIARLLEQMDYER